MAANSVEQFEEELGRKSRMVAFWSALGALIVLSALVYGSLRLTAVRKQTEEAEVMLRTKQLELREVEVRLNNVRTQLMKAEQTTRVYGLTLGAVSESPDKTTAAFKNAVAQVPDAIGITIQVAYRDQLPKAVEIAAQLRKLGYEVPPDQAIEIRGAHISNQNYVRYFFKSDEALAAQIAGQIKAIGVDAEPFSLVGEKDLGEVHPRNLELRLGRQYRPPGAELTQK